MWSCSRLANSRWHDRRLLICDWRTGRIHLVCLCAHENPTKAVFAKDMHGSTLSSFAFLADRHVPTRGLRNDFLPHLSTLSLYLSIRFMAIEDPHGACFSQLPILGSPTSKPVLTHTGVDPALTSGRLPTIALKAYMPPYFCSPVALDFKPNRASILLNPNPEIPTPLW